MADVVRVEREEPIATVRIDRPEALNALNAEVLGRIADAAEALDRDPAIRCILITGSDRAFAAGADIKEMFVGASAVSMRRTDIGQYWRRLARVRTPLLAAVSGFALGGGCELAMVCDVIVASETAQFGQPEVNLGIIAGAGGTQRLVKAVGKYAANDLLLTGRFMEADEAKAVGLVARVLPAATWLADAKDIARTIASKAPLAAQMTTELVDLAQQMPLEAGLAVEARSFEVLMESADAKEGVDAFVGKRKAEFKGR
ncbi:MAG: enoyl-CoA hydratase [Chloroflexi bacterium]|nr:enoyl-CoA hydratase [Chloroflexota bacterium]